MQLTPAQLLVLKNDILNDPTLSQIPRNAAGCDCPTAIENESNLSTHE